jgi:hypothetical protein
MTDVRQVGAVVLLIVGVAVVALGATWKYWHSPQSLWSREQANEYTEAWRTLKIAATSGVRPGDPKTDPKLAAAQARFDAIKAKLDSAIAVHEHTGMVLTAAGAAIVIAGAWLLWSRARSIPAEAE